MSDLIDRQAAIDECNKRGAEHIGYAIAHLPSAHPEPCEDAVSRKDVLDGAVMHYSVSGANIAYRNAVPVEYIESLPSAQPEIVLCKECKNWVEGYITDQDDFIPPKCGKYQQMVGHSSNDYCSLAERITDE